MHDQLRARITARRDSGAADRAFADRLLDRVVAIEREFDGGARERLLGLVSETLDRHVEIRVSGNRARRALERLREDQSRLLQLLRLALTDRDGQSLH